ncbi:hypothetical protein A2863_02730 [Candidatus Woesebacteria bacterium RIFCSPHIGHO2_01_FULL_38_9b]|uniref:Twin-arginine translocation signal domain-containing protein n=1 Tax=Candidatus Woesebacteria bacterium RIFCSPHIGHO2_01_FULL_38_9b TaxID=1802493 RepID=A0A1F7Y2Z5_9BACT|nr:MAG: hypothetical protein A2863_02730 [Candidatus Woesebacteria bacterium RIFCSPHIGHO2_01_FULL_38_9b]
METTNNNLPPSKSKISRRDFLKLSSVAGASVALALAELAAGKEGIHTPYGNFRFLYERHDVGIGINSEDIPKNTDIFYRELTLGEDLFKQSITEIFASRYSGGETLFTSAQTGFFLAPDIVTKLAQNKSEIMIGDVDLRYVDYLAGEYLRGAEFAAGFYTLLKTLSSKPEQSTPKTEASERAETTKDENSRREFLKTAATLGAVWAMSPTISFAIKMFGTGTPEQTAFKRVASRLEGIQSHIHPELASNFFRDAMTAIKLLTAGEEFERAHGTKANFTVLLEGGHSGVEDLIRLGPEVTRALVLSWPTSILEGIVKNNNGSEDFSSARIFNLPENITPQDVLSGSKWLTVTDRRVTDNVLVKELQRKLQVNK